MSAMTVFERNTAIRRLVREHTLTFDEIAKLFGVSRPTVSRQAKGVERKHRVSANGLARLAAGARKTSAKRAPPEPGAKAVDLASRVIDDARTYGQVAMRVGVSRGAVAGAVWRSKRRDRIEAEALLSAFGKADAA